MVTIHGSFLAMICTIHQYFAVLAAKNGSDMAYIKVKCFKMSLILPDPIIGIGLWKKSFRFYKAVHFCPISLNLDITPHQFVYWWHLLCRSSWVHVRFYRPLSHWIPHLILTTTGTYWEAASLFIQDTFYAFDSPVESKITTPLSKDKTKHAITVFPLKRKCGFRQLHCWLNTFEEDHNKGLLPDTI